PEVIFEPLSLFAGSFEGGAFAEDVCPGEDRDGDEYQHDELDRYAGLHQQGNQRHVARGLHSEFRVYFNRVRIVGPRSTGRKLSASTQHTVTTAWQRSSSPRRAR